MLLFRRRVRGRTCSQRIDIHKHVRDARNHADLRMYTPRRWWGRTLFSYGHSDITYERVDRHMCRISEKLELMHTYEIKQTLQLVM